MTTGVGGSSIEAELASLTRWPERAPAIGKSERLARQEKARALMAGLGADALMVRGGASLRYFTGVTWGQSERLVAMILPRRGKPVMICPAFEAGTLEATLKVDAAARYWEEDESPYALTSGALADLGVSRLAIDPEVPFYIFDGLRAAAPSLEIGDGAAVINGCRMLKSEAELALMRQAKAMTLEAHRRAARVLKAGISTGEVARFIDEAHRRLGADGGSTFCQVQFGAATQYPHGVPGQQILGEGDLVLIDTGCQVDGYHSDITRTYVFGEPSVAHRGVWAIEHEAQAAAFAAVRPGVPCEAIDAAARRVLEAAGLGPDYRLPGLPHRTGHGIGLSVHEPAYLVRGDRTPLAPGMCFSNEPMIVTPGAFGVRLEDHFHVTETGAAWFTQPSPSIDAPFGP
jgi:Xaa-Pro dipeptidase